MSPVFSAVLASAAFGPWGWGWCTAGALAVVVAFDVWARLAVVRFAMPLFEREPPFRLMPVPPDPTAERVRVPVPGATNDRGGPLELAVAVAPPAPGSPAGPGGRPRGVVVFCSETGGSKWFWRRYAEALPAAGFAVVSFEHRSCGDSDAQADYAPGHWPAEPEVADGLAVLRWALENPRFGGAPAGLYGVSRGACVALAAAAREPRAAAVASDGGFVTDRVLAGFARKWATMAVPKWSEPFVPQWHIRQTMWQLRKVAERKKGRKFLALQRDLPKLRGRPVWLAGGARDSYVTPVQTAGLADAIGAEAWIVPGAKHNAAREVAGAEYDRRLIAFFASVMPADGPARPNAGPAGRRPRLAGPAVAEPARGEPTLAGV